MKLSLSMTICLMMLIGTATLTPRSEFIALRSEVQDAGSPARHWT